MGNAANAIWCVAERRVSDPALLPRPTAPPRSLLMMTSASDPAVVPLRALGLGLGTRTTPCNSIRPPACHVRPYHKRANASVTTPTAELLLRAACGPIEFNHTEPNDTWNWIDIMHCNTKVHPRAPVTFITGHHLGSRTSGLLARRFVKLLAL